MLSSMLLRNSQQLISESLIHCWGFVRPVSYITLVAPAGKANDKETWDPGGI